MLTPVQVFPILDSDYNLIRTERRVLGDEIVLLASADGQVKPIPEPGTIFGLFTVSLSLMGFKLFKRN